MSFDDPEQTWQCWCGVTVAAEYASESLGTSASAATIRAMMLACEGCGKKPCVCIPAEAVQDQPTLFMLPEPKGKEEYEP